MGNRQRRREATPRPEHANYICRSCSQRELIPRDVIAYFDAMDAGDPTVPPRFACEKCGGEMWPEKSWPDLARELELPGP